MMPSGDRWLSAQAGIQINGGIRYNQGSNVSDMNPQSPTEEAIAIYFKPLQAESVVRIAIPWSSMA